MKIKNEEWDDQREITIQFLITQNFMIKYLHFLILFCIFAEDFLLRTLGSLSSLRKSKIGEMWKKGRKYCSIWEILKKSAQKFSKSNKL